MVGVDVLEAKPKKVFVPYPDIPWPMMVLILLRVYAGLNIVVVTGPGRVHCLQVLAATIQCVIPHRSPT